MRRTSRLRSLPLRLGLVMLVIGLTAFAALTNGFELFYRLTYLLLAALGGAYLWTRLGLTGLDATAEAGVARTQVGRSVMESITLRNRSRIPKSMLEVVQTVRRDRDPDGVATQQQLRIVSVPGSGQRYWRYEITCHQRGRYQVGPVVVRTGDPFGLFERQRALGGVHSLVVYPGAEDLPHFGVPPAELPGEGRHRRRTQFTTPNASGVREYVHGDSFNRIHWPSSARSDQLMVKEFDLDPASDLWVVLDLERRVQAGRGLDSTEEISVKIAASIIKHYIEQNRAVGLLAYGQEFAALKADRGGQQMAQAFELLAVASAQGTTPLGDLLAAEGKQFGRYTTAIIVTASIDEAWTLEVQHLLRRGARVAAILLDGSTWGGRAAPLLAISNLVALGVQTYVVRRGDDLAKALSTGSDMAAR
ncbi:MAG: DUF58 domain-containing protein [Chloroflexi bacterium]|nr:DUF58 domain-containing protein [Chloroflexota bacterium]